MDHRKSRQHRKLGKPVSHVREGMPSSDALAACLDWLELDDPSQAPVPTLSGLSPAEVARAHAWLKRLSEARRFAQDVQAWRDHRVLGELTSRVEPHG